MLLTEGRGNGEWETGNGIWETGNGNGSLGTSSQQNTAAKRTAHKQKMQHPLMITFVFPIAYINQLRKYKKNKNIYKNKKQETRTKGKEKNCFF